MDLSDALKIAGWLLVAVVVVTCGVLGAVFVDRHR